MEVLTTFFFLWAKVNSFPPFVRSGSLFACKDQINSKIQLFHSTLSHSPAWTGRTAWLITSWAKMDIVDVEPARVANTLEILVEVSIIKVVLIKSFFEYTLPVWIRRHRKFDEGRD